MYEDELGQIYWFLCDAKELYKLLPEYGGYAHGSITSFKKITNQKIIDKNNNYEYSLRPNMNKKNTKAYKLWQIMCQNFHTTDDNIYNILNH